MSINQEKRIRRLIQALILAYSAFFWEWVMDLMYSFIIRNIYLQKLKFLYLGNGICPRNCIWQRGKGQYRALSAHSGPINPALRRSYLKPHSLLPAWPRLGQEQVCSRRVWGQCGTDYKEFQSIPLHPFEQGQKVDFPGKTAILWKVQMKQGQQALE